MPPAWGAKRGQVAQKNGRRCKKVERAKSSGIFNCPSTSFIPIDISTKSRMQHKLWCKKLIRKVPKMLTSSASDHLVHIAVSGLTEYCSIFHFPSVRPFVLLRHRRDISTFLDILTVYTMKTIYFLNAYHLGW